MPKEAAVEAKKRPSRQGEGGRENERQQQDKEGLAEGSAKKAERKKVVAVSLRAGGGVLEK